MATTVNTKENYIHLTDTISSFQKEKSVIKNKYLKLDNFKIYYQGTSGFDIFKKGNFNDSNYIKGSVRLLNEVLNLTVDKLSFVSDEIERNDIKNTYLGRITNIDFTIENHTQEEKNFLISYGLKEAPSTPFIDRLNKILAGEDDSIALLTITNGLIYKILYYALHDIGKDGEPYFDYTKVSYKTFNQFAQSKAPYQDTPSLIEGSLKEYVKEINGVINDLFNSLEIANEITYKLPAVLELEGKGGGVYNINSHSNVAETLDEVKFYSAMSNAFKNSLKEYVEKGVDEILNKNISYPRYTDILENIKKNYINTRTGNSGVSSFPDLKTYNSLSSIWLYHMLYYPNNGEQIKKKRPKSVIEKTLENTTGDLISGSNLEALLNAYEETPTSNNTNPFGAAVNEYFGSGSMALSKFNNRIEEVYKRKLNIELEKRGAFSIKTLSGLTDIANDLKFNGINSFRPTTSLENELSEKIVEAWDKKVAAFTEEVEKTGIEKKAIGALINDFFVAPENTITSYALVNTSITLSKNDYNNFINYNIGNYTVWLFAFLIFFNINEKNEIINEEGTGNSVAIYKRSEVDVNKFNHTKFKGSYILESKRKGLFDELKKVVEDYLNSIADRAKATKEDTVQYLGAESRNEKYRDYEANLLSRKGVYENEFFYLENLSSKKMIPTSKYLEIDFMVYDLENPENGPDYISVTKRKSEIVEDLNKPYSDTYFSDFTLEDLGNEKKIKLSLKSKDEFNLESIIYRSILGPISDFQKKQEGSETSDILSSVESRKCNFRVRFGYSEKYVGSDSVIDEERITSYNYANRTRTKKPVIRSPWLYFTITGLKAKAIEKDFIFEVEGVTLGANILNEYTVYSLNINKHPLIREDISPTEAVMILGDMLHNSSNGKISIISTENDNHIITGASKNMEERIKTKGDENLTFKASMVSNKWVKGNLKSSAPFNEKDSIRNFDIITKRDGSNKNVTIREMMDRLMDWLPTRQYVIIEEGGSPKAELVRDYTLINMKDENLNLVSLKPSYEVLEVERAKDDFISLIRIYYKEPESSSLIRCYSHKYNQNTLVTSFDVENEIELGNVQNYCAIVSSGYNAIFSSFPSVLKETVLSTNGVREALLSKDSTKLTNKYNNETETVLIPSVSVISEPISSDYSKSGTETDNLIEKHLKTLAYDSLKNIEMWPFKGTIEVLGDPYYLTDGNLQLGNDMIFIDFKRNKKVNDGEEYTERSYYTGLYYITGIEHSFSSSGSFRTKLKILKYTI